ncbi:MAG: ATP-binding cassette domain-containing protein, partial [Caldilineaceae bacterium]|nr:ATP-binding cassette domain-containing protein [Caldilineaceae bacterium]
MSQTENGNSAPLVRVEKLTKHFSVRIGAYGETKATVHALDDVSFNVQRGETLGLVGESGCGKSTAGLTMLQLHRPTSGQVFFDESEVTGLSDKALRPLRRRMQIIFQDPYSTLSPRM